MMKHSVPIRHLLLLGLLLLSTTRIFAQYTNGQNAALVLGQPSFVTNTANTPAPPGTATSSNFSSPNGVVVDNATGKVFIADTTNNRVLRFSSAAAMVNGGAAEFVFGQANFTSSTGTTTSSGMKGPTGVAIDSAGNLWVADSTNNRVLRFSNAANITTASPVAAGELGQPAATAFTTATASVTSTGMTGPSSIAIDSAGTLYVSDRGANRILRFSNAASAANGAAADGLFGQSNFLASSASTTSTTLNSPCGVAVDSSGNLWVADLNNSRVLRFNSADQAAIGASASLVLGQTLFTTATPAVTQSGMSIPSGVAFDSAGRLYVSDFGNNRILVFQSPALLASGGNADIVLGQTNFTSNSAATPPTQSSLKNPFSMAYSASGSLWVVDTNNNRLLKFLISAGSPAIQVSPAKPKLKNSKTRSFSFIVTNTSSASDLFGLSVFVSSTSKKKTSSIKYLYNGTDVTSALTNGTFTTPLLSQNQSVTIVTKVAVRNPSKAKGKINITLTATSKTLSTTIATTTAHAVIEE